MARPDVTSARYQYVVMDLGLATWEVGESIPIAPNEDQRVAREDTQVEIDNATQALCYDGTEDWDNFYWTDVLTDGMGQAAAIINRRSAEDGPNPIGFGLSEEPGTAYIDAPDDPDPRNW